ncbi:MAG TPA: Ku protein [Gammaproteobacteria bacterium]|jgi:DNA end-binding protein Ku|nr:Ku protein [Gammaproteobacteria bacterium]
MSRSNWKGSISFGLVSIPMMLYSIENKKADISFHQIDKRDNARIKYQRINVNTGKSVPWEDITRGYEYDKETTIPVPDSVLKKVAGENSRTIDIQTFIDKKDLNIFSIERSYFILPDEKGKGTKGYVILRETLKDSHKIGIAKVIISTKEYLAAIIPHEDVLILSLLKYAHELRNISDLSLPDKTLSSYKISQKEIDMAKQLIKSMSSKWRPEKYTDDYQAAIHTWVEETVNHMPHKKIKARSQHATANVVNFAELLKKSINKSKKTAPHGKASNDKRMKRKTKVK